jgi:enoyl-CoA hydratase
LSQAAVFLNPREMVSRLQTTAALEAFSHLTGEAVLVVDLADADASCTDAEIEIACHALSQLPCPTIGIGAPTATDSGRAIAPHLDVVLNHRAQVDTVLSGIDRSPMASASLVQLLRMNETLDIHKGLIAESLVYSMLQSGPEFGGWLTRYRAAHPAKSDERLDIAPEPEPAVRMHRDGDRLALTLNRPDCRNAFSVDMRDGLVAGLEVATADSSLSEVILSGEGPAFCSGGDLDEFGTLPDPSTGHAIRSARSAGRLLSECASRVRVQVHGACIGAGIELPAFASCIVAASDSFFALPEISMGLVPGAGGTASIPRRIGRQRTAWWALTGARIVSQTALDWGLIDEINDEFAA